MAIIHEIYHSKTRCELDRPENRKNLTKVEVLLILPLPFEKKLLAKRSTFHIKKNSFNFFKTFTPLGQLSRSTNISSDIAT